MHMMNAWRKETDMLTPEQIKSARKIPEVLLHRSKQMSEYERARYTYNEAITDAAEFLKTLSEKNPASRVTLLSAEMQIRAWLIIPAEGK